MSKRSCEKCALAVWKRTAAGRLHPGGDGVCGWKMPPITLPAAYRWTNRYFGSAQSAPDISGGWINRKTQTFIGCPTWEAKP